jgi:hypothetical protein
MSVVHLQLLYCDTYSMRWGCKQPKASAPFALDLDHHNVMNDTLAWLYAAGGEPLSSQIALNAQVEPTMSPHREGFLFETLRLLLLCSGP